MTSALGFSSLILADGANNYGPLVARLPDGRLICVYSIGDGTGGGQLNSDIYCRTSSDDGRTWSAAALVIAHPTSFAYYAFGLAVTPAGTIVIAVSKQANDGSSDTSWVLRGTVSGGVIAWGSLISLPTAYGASVPYGAALALQNGKLMQSVYQVGGGLSVLFDNGDDGQSWGGEVVVAAAGGYSEASFVQLSGGTIVGVLRKDSGTFGYALVKSSNANGSAWGAPAAMFGAGIDDAPGGHCLVATPDDHLFLLGRFNGVADANETGWSSSVDGGTTWSAPAIYYEVGSAGYHINYGAYTYGGGIYDQKTRTIMMALALGGFVVAKLFFQQWTPP